MHGPSPLLLQLKDVIHGGIIVDLLEGHSRFHPSRGCQEMDNGSLFTWK